MYPLGTLKVVWVEDNIEYLSSDMFKPDQINQAIAYGKTKGAFMIMELISQQKDLYRWKVLPYGKHKEYLKGVGLSKKIGEIFGNESGYTDTEVQKTQNIRLVDVFLIGPVLIYASTFKTLPTYLRVALLLIGVATIIYNGNNYIKNK
jgi:hypothetical protein